MSRMVVFGVDGYSLGEVHANVNRTWAINEGSQATAVLAVSQVKEYLEFGRTVLIEHDRLPNWAGVIDTPWTAKPPITMTMYSAEYLLSLRTLDYGVQFQGQPAFIASKLLELANAQEDMHLVLGEMENAVQRIEVFAQRPIWEQLITVVKNAAMEMQVRSEKDSQKRLNLYLDIKNRLGVDTGFALHDGAGGNMEITDAKVDGQIWNRIIGLASKSTNKSRLLTEFPFRDEASIQRYRLRSIAVQSPDVESITQLNENTKNSLNASKDPSFTLTVNALDVGDTFNYLRLGNGVNIHAANVWLPGGIHGWRGVMRIKAMAYDESANKVAMTLVGEL